MYTKTPPNKDELALREYPGAGKAPTHTVFGVGGPLAEV